MRKRNKTELDLHFPVRFEAETPEAVVELDVSEDCLGFDWASAPVHQASLAGEQFPGFPFECVCGVVHLNGTPVGLPL